MLVNMRKKWWWWWQWWLLSVALSTWSSIYWHSLSSLFDQDGDVPRSWVSFNRDKDGGDDDEVPSSGVSSALFCEFSIFNCERTQAKVRPAADYHVKTQIKHKMSKLKQNKTWQKYSGVQIVNHVKPKAHKTKHDKKYRLLISCFFQDWFWSIIYLTILRNFP